MPEKKLPEIVQFLNDNDGELRRLLARRIKNIVKMIPELQFYEDEVQKEAEHLEEVFSNLREERRKKYGAEDAGPSVNPDDYDDLDTSQ
jgi:ribosome-binding factor A